MPKEYTVKEAVQFLQERNSDIVITEDTVYHKIHRKEIPAEKRKTQKGERYFIREEDLLDVRFRRPKQGGKPLPSNRVYPNWQKIFGYDDKFWRDWKTIEIKSDEDLRQLSDMFGDLVDNAGLAKLLFEEYGVWYTPLAFKQRRINGTLMAVGKSAELGGWWYPVKQIKYLRWRPRIVKAKKKKKD